MRWNDCHAISSHESDSADVSTGYAFPRPPSSDSLAIEDSSLHSSFHSSPHSVKNPCRDFVANPYRDNAFDSLLDFSAFDKASSARSPSRVPDDTAEPLDIVKACHTVQVERPSWLHSVESIQLVAPERGSPSDVELAFQPNTAEAHP